LNFFHGQVNYFHPKVANAMIIINQQLVVDVGEGSSTNLVVTHNGVEVLECLCGDDIW
jgi:hypothetical protein